MDLAEIALFLACDHQGVLGSVWGGKAAPVGAGSQGVAGLRTRNAQVEKTFDGTPRLAYNVSMLTV